MPVRRQPIGLTPDPDAASESVRAAEPFKTEPHRTQPSKTKTSGLQATAFPTARLSVLDPNESRSQLDGFPPALGSLCGGGLFSPWPPCMRFALRKSPPPANSNRSQSNDSQPAPRQEALPNTTPSNTAPAALPRPLNQRQSRPQPLPAFESRKGRRRPIQSSPSPPSRNQPANTQALPAKDIPGLLKKAEGRRGWRLENGRREFDIVLHLDPNNQAPKPVCPD